MAAPADSPEMLSLQAGLRQVERQRSMLIAVALLAVAMALVDRVGDRVWAIAIKDARSGSFVEQAYVPQRDQAMQVLGALKQQACTNHPFYRAAPQLFDEARPDFDEPVVVRRVRRVTPLTAATGALDLPLRTAVDALARLVKVDLDAYAVLDVRPGGQKRRLVSLPNLTLAKQATDTRLNNVTRQVEEQLRGTGGRLTEKPRFLETIEIERRRVPVDQVMSVDQAVAYLTCGELRDSWHLVQTGETDRRGLQRIAGKYDAKVADLEAWNPGRDLSTLNVGDRLIVRRPEPPLTVLTVEHRTYTEEVERGGRPAKHRVTVEIRRHNGVELEALRKETERKPVT
ncbi:MAG: LysM peptidoglycan-binding domain-containing protein [Armatimonadetes bacterium]|nr:LysM peptidoglycan-binding domain-containing protein [Armatimonadota bacterium]